MAQADTGIALQVQEAVKNFMATGTKAIKALKNISLEIKNNEFFTLLGPSGCGKTTLLRMIAGFEEPTAGTITLHGVDIQSMPAHKRRVNTVFSKLCAIHPYDNCTKYCLWIGKFRMGTIKDKRPSQ